MSLAPTPYGNEPGSELSTVRPTGAFVPAKAPPGGTVIKSARPTALTATTTRFMDPLLFDSRSPSGRAGRTRILAPRPPARPASARGVPSTPGRTGCARGERLLLSGR